MLIMEINPLPKIDANSNYGVFASAHVLLAHFTDLLVKEISVGFEKLYGADWFKTLQNERNEIVELNLRDPQAVLKDLARNGASQLRFALNSAINQSNRKSFYDGIDDLLGERNAWVHRQLAESKDELLDLASNADALLDLLTREKLYGDWISSLLTTVLSSVPVYDQETDLDQIGISDIREEEQHAETTMSDEYRLGQNVTSRFLSHTYVVGESGAIIDRNSGLSLSSIYPEYAGQLSVLIQTLRQGSRLRLTEEGQLCSFMDDHWGFLVQVNPAEWFPNHIRIRTQE